MKERLNLTIDRELLETMKVYAAGKDMSLSELVENYFISVTTSIRHNNILDLMDRLEPPVARGREGGIKGVNGGGNTGGVKGGGGYGV
jgi:uncharacterized membrane protein